MRAATTHPADDALALPLEGTRLVEASAGTGKTFTIATLYLRLILERGLGVDEIVVATFTRAAAAELSERLRERLRLACDLLNGPRFGKPEPLMQSPGQSRERGTSAKRTARPMGGPEGANAAGNPVAPSRPADSEKSRVPDSASRFPDDEQKQAAACAESGDAQETRRVIGQAEANGIARAELARRALAARYALDTAMIGTLHGFCHRALAEFGFSAGLGLQQPELVDDVRALQDEIVRDFWRRGSADAATAARLTAAWGTPDELARQARDPRWRGREVDELPPPLDDDEALDPVARARAAIATWNADAMDRARAEIGRAIGNGNARNPRLRKLDAICAAALQDGSDRAFLQQARPLAADFASALLADKSWFHGPFKGAEMPVVQRLADAIAAIAAADAATAARLLLKARRYLEAELPRRLNERNLMSHDTAIDQLATALESARGDALATRLGQHWQAALIDEFQDTDAAQWTIVRRLFGETSLIIVGDPKQAIYGFRGGDVYAWRAAINWARQQQANAAGLRLSLSYRAGAGMCRAINALFSRPAADAGPGAFIEPIAHPDLESAEPVRALLRDGEPIPALQLWWLDPEEVGHAAKSKVPSKPYVRAAVERACVAWIGGMLSDRAVALRDQHGATARLQPQHISVLVNSNAEAFAMQAALARTGIPATCNLQASIYESAEAEDLALLLAAAANPDDLASARAARASVLIGDSAGVVAATCNDDRAQAALLEETSAWAARLARRGPVAWLLPLLETAAPRLLALADGNRRVANYLQLIELLQGLDAQSFGAGDLAVRFGRARVEAADTADGERLRLDTDEKAVTVSTIHAAKGLEYAVVLLPYAVLGKQPGDNRISVPLYWYHTDDGDARVALGKGTDAAISRCAQREASAEDVRRLYVAVTRAAALCVLPYGPTTATRYSALFHLLQVAGRSAPLEDCREALEELAARAGDAAEVIDGLPRPHGRVAVPAKSAPHEALQARSFARTGLERDWQVWSFSRLVRGSPNDAEPDRAPGAGDGGELVAVPHAGLAGPRFGTAVHAVFEGTDFAHWRDAAAVPESEQALIETSLRTQGLPDRGIGMEAAVAQVGDCIRGAINATLPCGVRLCDVAAADRRAEIEFHFALAPADTAKLYPLLHRFHYQEHRAGVAPARLAGLMTGRIDLTFRHDGKFHVIDWKTNLCPAYDEAALKAEIARHDYDLQWLIYTLALHRWLRQRLAGYDYDRAVGDVYYLFVRGMAAGAGVYANRPPPELIAALDELFAGGGA